MKTVIIASKNAGKVAEFEKLFAGLDVTVRSLLDFPDAPDVEETGETFQENARLKAEAIASAYGMLAIADDSGLAVDALDGRPGVFSARYAGLEKDDRKNIEKLLKELEGVPFKRRTARFCCVLAVSGPGRPTRFVEGECRGYIAEAPSGTGGFGYDPVFYVPEKGMTFAEMPAQVKNQISHRAKAMEKLLAVWPEIARDGE